mmetsp:Transcript_35443/g.33632  ORF Transcript_35443/g.33632 Transcript_35443/m.33632 type:complete len:188 (-) Transcript_35443:392-955(-)
MQGVMSGMNMNMTDDSMSMAMVMTFGKFTDYKLKLLFNDWDIQTVTQYIFTWFFVVFFVIFWFGLKHWTQTMVENSLRKLINQNKIDKVDGSENASDSDYQLGGTRQPLLGLMSSATLKRVFILRIIHAFMSAVIYGLALLLMLVAMTYNVGLFLALLVGYFLGDLLFFSIGIQSNYANSNLQQDCH